MPLLHPDGYRAMLVSAVHRHHRWVGHLDAFSLESLPGMLWYHEASHHHRGFQIRPSSHPSGPMSEVHGASRNRDLSSTLEATNNDSNILFWESLGQP